MYLKNIQTISIFGAVFDKLNKLKMPFKCRMGMGWVWSAVRIITYQEKKNKKKR